MRLGTAGVDGLFQDEAENPRLSDEERKEESEMSMMRAELGGCIGLVDVKGF